MANFAFEESIVTAKHFEAEFIVTIQTEYFYLKKNCTEFSNGFNSVLQNF